MLHGLEVSDGLLGTAKLWPSAGDQGEVLSAPLTAWSHDSVADTHIDNNLTNAQGSALDVVVGELIVELGADLFAVAGLLNVGVVLAHD